MTREIHWPTDKDDPEVGDLIEVPIGTQVRVVSVGDNIFTAQGYLNYTIVEVEEV